MHLQLNTQYLVKTMDSHRMSYFLHSIVRVLSLILLVSLLFQDCLANDFNDQLMPRITERLDEFFGLPIELVRHYLKYLERGDTFTAKAADRNSIFKDIFVQTIAAQESGFTVEITLAFEDGTYIGVDYSEGEFSFSYREPGTSGYELANIQRDDPNYKNSVACFNSTNGMPQSCLLEVGDMYIECVNGCELIPGPTSVNETVTESSKETILYRNYKIKEVHEGDELGYIPLLFLCSNRRGEPEQRLGYVIKDPLTNELDNCYFGDKTTLVNNSLTGDYVACGGDGAICDDAFHGAYLQIQYDPRFRPFYTSMREQLKPRWSKPFFYYGAFFLSIGYEHPIFRAQSDSVTDVKVFEGCVSTYYQLRYITDFLKHEYSSTEVQVLVVERNFPHYIIANSYHEEQFQLKAVLVSNETQPCPDPKVQEYINNSSESYGYKNELCTIVRIPLSDMKDSKNTSDVVSYRAFTAHQKKNFPTESTVHFKLSDAIGSPAYISQGKLYQLPESDNSEWHVIAILPMRRATNDSALPGDISFDAICLFGSLGFIGCLASFWLLYNRRMEKSLIHSDWRLTCAFMLSCAVLNLSSFTLLGENTDATCLLRMWTFNGLFGCALSPLCAKIWRLARIPTPSTGNRFERPELSNRTALLNVLPLILFQLFILMIFTIVDPPKPTEELGVGDGVGVQQITCQQQTDTFLYIQVGLDGLLILIGCVLVYRTRDLDPKFGEVKALGFCFYNIAFTGIVTIATVKLINLDQESQMILHAVGVFWASFFCSFSFILPRLLRNDVHNEQRLDSVRSLHSSIRSRRMLQRSTQSGLNSRFDVSGLEMIPEENEADKELEQIIYFSGPEKSHVESSKLNSNDEDIHTLRFDSCSVTCEASEGNLYR